MILMMIGTTELVIIAGLALLLFGGKKLPELMKGMGQGVRSFKEGINSPAETEPSRDEHTEEDDGQQATDTAPEAPTDGQ